jgi:hypothetical protein
VVSNELSADIGENRRPNLTEKQELKEQKTKGKSRKLFPLLLYLLK